MERRRKNNIIIGTLCAVLVLMGVGYAILSTTLNIGATANITGDFDIHFTNIQRSSSTISDSSILSTIDAGTGITANTSSRAGTFTAILQKPTDYVIYTVSVANTGSIDGYLTFSFEDTNSNFDYYKDFYSVEFIRDDVDPDISTDILQPNASFTDTEVLENTTGTRTYKIKVTFKESATSFPDPTHEINNEQVGNFECSLNLTYSQQAPSQGGNNQQACYTAINETKQLRKINASTGESLGTATAANLSAGDLVGFGTSDIESNEQFYVLENNNGQLKLLSRYDINVSYTDGNSNNHQRAWDNCSRDTRGLQDKTLSLTRTNVNVAPTDEEINALMEEAMAAGNMFFYGSVPFSSTNFWWDEGSDTYVSGYGANASIYANSGIKTYVDSYASTLSTMGLTGATGTVLSIQDLGAICNNDFTQNSSGTSGCPNYVFETSYWLGSAEHGSDVWYVYANGSVSGSNFGFDQSFGVRPVINVSLS